MKHTLEKDEYLTPLNSAVGYRRVAEAALSRGEGISWGERSIRFRGEAEVPPGTAVELHIEGVAGVVPPLVVYLEIQACDPEALGGFLFSGAIKGIVSRA